MSRPPYASPERFMKKAPKKIPAPAKSTRLGECCEVLKLVLQRDVASGGTPRGFEVAPWVGMGAKQGKTGEKLIYRFCKAKRTDDRSYGRGSQFADSTFATAEFCPFCGARLKDAK